MHTVTTAAEAVQALRGEWATYEQLAKLLGVSASTVRSHMHRAGSRILLNDIERIKDARPGSPKKRFRIRAVWRHIYRAKT